MSLTIVVDVILLVSSSFVPSLRSINVVPDEFFSPQASKYTVFEKALHSSSSQYM